MVAIGLVTLGWGEGLTALVPGLIATVVGADFAVAAGFDRDPLYVRAFGRPPSPGNRPGADAP